MEVHQKTTSMSVKDISQTGITLEINSNGQAKGKIEANGFGTTTVWQKTDGTSTWEGKNVMTTKDGDFVAAWGKGTGKQTGPTTSSWEGEMHFMSQSPKLAWLNTAKVWVEGNADQAKGEAHARFYLQKQTKPNADFSPVQCTYRTSDYREPNDLGMIWENL